MDGATLYFVLPVTRRVLHGFSAITARIIGAEQNQAGTIISMVGSSCRLGFAAAWVSTTPLPTGVLRKQLSKKEWYTLNMFQVHANA
jgi:hypothetical protein